MATLANGGIAVRAAAAGETVVCACGWISDVNGVAAYPVQERFFYRTWLRYRVERGG